MGLGGDGFSGLIDPIGTGSTQAQGTITLATGGSTAGQQFQIGPQVFTLVASGTNTGGNVVLSSSTTTEGNNIVTAITSDDPDHSDGRAQRRNGGRNCRHRRQQRQLDCL